MREITKEIINTPESFLQEIINNHGKDSMQYVMAEAMVNEIKHQLSTLRG